MVEIINHLCLICGTKYSEHSNSSLKRCYQIRLIQGNNALHSSEVEK